MTDKKIPLEEKSIASLFAVNDEADRFVYEIPIYQRNYAWGKDEIEALVRDIYDAYTKAPSKAYYIGTLVSYDRENGVFEVIDGQQRLTTIYLMLVELGIKCRNKLTYRARKKSDDTLKAIPDFNVVEKDDGVASGYENVVTAIKEIANGKREAFKNYFLNQVHIIHYHVPKDIDLNHYFEIMNSRGEQLEKHEIIKAKLMGILNEENDRKVFNCIWECCAGMGRYAQQNLRGLKVTDIFGDDGNVFLPENFDGIVKYYEGDGGIGSDRLSIATILKNNDTASKDESSDEFDYRDMFLPIIDFPNFLLIVLKLVLVMEKKYSDASDISLDDKELLKEFENAKLNAEEVKKYAYYLLKTKFLLDNYVVHHQIEEERKDSNPWCLKKFCKNGKTYTFQNVTDDESDQDHLVQILSMFEVSFAAKQRKHYLVYVLRYLLEKGQGDLRKYADYLGKLAEVYLHERYLNNNDIKKNDYIILAATDIDNLTVSDNSDVKFSECYGDGSDTEKQKPPLFIFNYLDYKIWKLYYESARGKTDDQKTIQEFFEELGCKDFGLEVFNRFYFSTTRRSLEHYYPQSLAGENGGPDERQINCFGNYAMISSAANSSGSNWSPATKIDKYLDQSEKINPIGVASLKFRIMMEICRDKQTSVKQPWGFDEIKAHQEKMLKILFNK